MLESVVSWLTPTALFLLLNLVIGTIAFTTYWSSSSADPSAASKLFRSRSPSIVLDRLKSFNLYSSSSSSDPATTETIQTVQIPNSEQGEPEPEPKPVTKPEPQPEQEHNIVRTQSDTQPAAGEMPKKLAKKMKKSATLNHFDFLEPEQESSPPPKRPATMREREREKEQKEEDAEEDARADDFINQFRQQLKLQRLDSIIRYKEMLNRGN